jgi:hypothetical protein
MTRRWPSAVSARARKQFEMDWAGKEAFVREGTCSECGGWLDGRTTTAGDGVKTGPCECNQGETGVDSLLAESPRRGEGEAPPEPSPRTPFCEEQGCYNLATIAGRVCGLHPISGSLPPEFFERGDSMPETQLPVTESSARPMFAPLENSLAGLVDRYTALKTRPITRMVVEEAKALDTDAKAFLAQAEASEARKAIDSAFKVHRFLSGMFKKATDPANEIRRWSSSVLSRWEQERRRVADEERRKREQEAKEEQERQRKAEIAHLKEQGHKEEAKELAKAPLPPVALPDEAQPTGKVAGVSVTEVFKLKEIIDAKLLAGYLVEHPEDLISLFEPKAGEWKRRQTSARGKWNVPGVIFSKETETRNRS